jgi:beta-phosphoglucomutase-like phosphatase (HAD superfamily)
VEFVVAAEDAPAKPAPDGYQRALSRLVRRDARGRVAALGIEDSAQGASAARGAGVACVVLGGAPDEVAGADAWVASLDGQTVASLARLTSGAMERAG